jgi:hypothetical protein
VLLVDEALEFLLPNHVVFRMGLRCDQPHPATPCRRVETPSSASFPISRLEVENNALGLHFGPGTLLSARGGFLKLFVSHFARLEVENSALGLHYGLYHVLPLSAANQKAS